MKIRDNETGEVFEYGTNIHHALRISENGGCLTFENLQNGDGSLKSGDGGYSFVLDDGKTPEESVSPDAVNGSTYANIGGFCEDNTKNDGWIPVEERLPGEPKENPAFDDKPLELYLVDMGGSYPLRAFWNGKQFTDGWSILNVIAWRPLPEPYRLERSGNEP
ncbi:MAG TPA: DUF551 domain-containing protein [Candidatus Mediterraneibacter excrementigallinarum]|nr:DUF551 domain-containing protein [Candidatus Mediterraneibacter excrementigallinarum]